MPRPLSYFLIAAGLAIVAAPLLKRRPVTAVVGVCEERIRAHTSIRIPRR